MRASSCWVFSLVGSVVACLAGLGASAAESADKMVYERNSVTVERVTTSRETEVKVMRKAKPIYTAAIFVKNRAAAKVPDDKVLVVQDLVVGHLDGKGFRVIAREDAINSVAKFAGKGPNKGPANPSSPDLDELLSQNTSALRLAEHLGADYILNASITTYGQDKQRYTGHGVDVVGIKSQLRLSYQLLDTTVGGALTAGVVTVHTMDRIQAGNQIVRENLLDDLLDAAAADMATMLEKAAKAGSIAPPDEKKEVEFAVHCGIANLTVPEIAKNEQGEYVVMAGRYRIEAMAVTVELDGVVLGTTPGPFKARPGLHKMKLRRELFQDWEGTVKVSEGLAMSVALQMTPRGLGQFMDMAREFNAWTRETKLNEAKAKAWEGFAKQMEQSGCRVDSKTVVNVNSTEKPNLDVHVPGIGVDR